MKVHGLISLPVLFLAASCMWMKMWSASCLLQPPYCCHSQHGGLTLWRMSPNKPDAQINCFKLLLVMVFFHATESHSRGPEPTRLRVPLPLLSHWSLKVSRPHPLLLSGFAVEFDWNVATPISTRCISLLWFARSGLSHWHPASKPGKLKLFTVCPCVEKQITPCPLWLQEEAARSLHKELFSLLQP